MDTIWIIAILAIFAVMTFINSRKQKASQAAAKEQKASLIKGTKVMTTSGLIGVIASNDGSEIVINSEGSMSRWLIDAVNIAPELLNSNIDSNTDNKAIEKTVEKAAEKKPAAKKAPAKKATTKKPATKKPAAKKDSK